MPTIPRHEHHQYEIGPWSSWTTTWTQSATITHTKNYGEYSQVGKLVMCRATLTATSAGTANNAFTVPAPIAASYTGDHSVVGSGTYLNAAQSQLFTVVVVLTSSGFRFRSTAGVDNSFAGQTANYCNKTIGSGDILAFDALYEAS